MTANTALITLTRRQTKFAMMANLLAQYTAANNGQNPPQKYKTADGIALGEWVSTQRSRHNGVESKAGHTAWEIELLEQAGIVWTAKRGRPDTFIGGSTAAHLAALKTFHATHGHANPTTGTVVNGLNLGYWLRNRREEFDKGNLDCALHAELVALGVMFRGESNEHGQSLYVAARRRVADQSFAEHIARLVQYKADHGDIRVRSDYIHPDGNALGRWVVDQRAARKNNALSEQRIAALDALGMIWSDTPGRRDYDSTFTARLACIGQIKAATGNANASAAYKCDHTECEKRDIGQWLHRLRKKYRADVENGTSKVTPEQVMALIEAGVDLDPTGRIAQPGTRLAA